MAQHPHKHSKIDTTDRRMDNYIASIMAARLVQTDLVDNCKPESDSTPQSSDLNAHGLPPLPASRVFNGNCQLAFIYGHVTLLLQLIYSFHDVPAQLLGLLQALHACQKQHNQAIMIAFVPEGQVVGSVSLVSIQKPVVQQTCSDTWSSPITLSGRSSGLATPPVDMSVCWTGTSQYMIASGRDVAN